MLSKLAENLGTETPQATARLHLPEWFDRGFLLFEIVCLWFSLLRMAECEIPHQGRKCGNLRNHATVPSRSLFHHTCVIARNSSNSANQLKNNPKHTAHQSQRRQRHQRNNGAQTTKKITVKPLRNAKRSLSVQQLWFFHFDAPNSVPLDSLTHRSVVWCGVWCAEWWCCGGVVCPLFQRGRFERTHRGVLDGHTGGRVEGGGGRGRG